MGIGEKRLQDAFQATLGSKADVTEEISALLGAYLNGQKTIVVNGQPDYVWCRTRGSTSERVRAFNAHAGGVAHHWDLPIIIVRDKTNPDIWKVQGRDVRRYQTWGATDGAAFVSPYLTPHGRDHSFSSQAGMGSDPVWVFKRQMMPLLPHPQPTGSMSIDLGSDFYYFGGQYNWFSSTGTPSLSSLLPTGAANGRFVTIYIDGETGNPLLLSGPEINAIIPPIDAGDYISVPTPSQGVPIAAVFLLTGTSRLGWGEIFDLRWPHTPVPATGSSLSIYDEGSFIGDASRLDFVGRGVTAAFNDLTATITIPVGNISTQTGNYTATATDYTIICDATDGAITISLPAAASSTGRIYYIKKIDSSGNTVTIDGDGSETIDGATTAVITAQYETVTVHCDGIEWWII